MTFCNKYSFFASVFLHIGIVLTAVLVMTPQKYIAETPVYVELVSEQNVVTYAKKPVNIVTNSIAKKNVTSAAKSPQPAEVKKHNSNKLSDITEQPVYEKTSEHLINKPVYMPKNDMDSLQQAPQPQQAQEVTAQKRDVFTSRLNVESKLISSSADTRVITASVVDSASKFAAPAEFEFGAAGSPTFVHREVPEYPFLARRLGKEGTVRLRLNINEKGELIKIEVVEHAGYGFTESAKNAVRKSRFAPAVVNGSKVSSKALLTVKFRLTD
ncbi:MAG: TonB family protein [Nitrospirae bacterium]|nr:TonB family protein [Nitrospirota bacterium]